MTILRQARNCVIPRALRFGGGQGLLSGTKQGRSETKSQKTQLSPSLVINRIELSSSWRGRACLGDDAIAHTSEVRMPSTCTTSIEGKLISNPAIESSHEGSVEFTTLEGRPTASGPHILPSKATLDVL